MMSATPLVVVRKKGRLTDHEVLRAFDSAQQIAVTLLPVAIPSAVKLAMQFGIYSYDAYYLQCCIENRLPLLSLDVRMCDVAKTAADSSCGVNDEKPTPTQRPGTGWLEVLEESKRGEVIIRRRRGDAFESSRSRGPAGRRSTCRSGPGNYAPGTTRRDSRIPQAAGQLAPRAVVGLRLFARSPAGQSGNPGQLPLACL